MTGHQNFPDFRFAGEAALDDLIADPIVHAMMRVDGLAEADLRRVMAQAAARQRCGGERAYAA